MSIVKDWHLKNVNVLVHSNGALIGRITEIDFSKMTAKQVKDGQVYEIPIDRVEVLRPTIKE